ncbi:hypothetical protein Tco_1461969 [Tanacetum coccineum]
MIHEDKDNDTNDGDDDSSVRYHLYVLLPFSRCGEDRVHLIEEEDGEWIRFLGSNSSSGIKKYRGLNSNDGGNIEDGVKIAGEAIGSGDKIGDSLA